VTVSPSSTRFSIKRKNRFFIPLTCENGLGSTKMHTFRGTRFVVSVPVDSSHEPDVRVVFAEEGGAPVVSANLNVTASPSFAARNDTDGRGRGEHRNLGALVWIILALDRTEERITVATPARLPPPTAVRGVTPARAYRAGEALMAGAG
jgi:hypothetical protein